MSNLTNNGAPTVEIQYEMHLGELIEACVDCLPWSARIMGTKHATKTERTTLTVVETHAIGCRVSTLWGKCHEDVTVSIDDPCTICAAISNEGD